MNGANTAAFFSVSGDRFVSLLSKKEQWTLEEQQQLYQSTWMHSINDRFPRNVAVRIQTLKRFVALLETLTVEVYDKLYEHLAYLMTIKNDCRDFHTYFIGDKLISIECHRNIVENGTTGLHSWPAGKQYAEFALENKDEFENKSVLELGCGTGLTGIIIGSFCNTRNYLFTDHNDSVLELIEKNVSANNLTTKWNTCIFDWNVDGNLFPHEIENSSPEIIVACDVVFDVNVMPHLCRTLHLLLYKFRCKAFVLSTVRNWESIQLFEQELHTQNLLFTKRLIGGRNVPPFYISEKETFILHEITANKFMK